MRALEKLVWVLLVCLEWVRVSWQTVSGVVLGAAWWTSAWN